METTSKVTSAKYSLNVKDLLRGLYMAAVVPALLIVQQSLDAGNFNINWKLVAMTAIASAVGYLVKNYVTPASVVTPVNDATATKAAETLDSTAK